MSVDLLPALRPFRVAWNKGRIVGQKRPLMPRHVWSIRVRLEMAGNLRDLALFNMAVDSKLRGCDLVALRVRDIFSAGRVKERASIVQTKTDRPVRFEITEITRRSLDRWIAEPEMRGAGHLWPSRFRNSPHLSTRQYARIVRGWVTSVGLEPSAYTRQRRDNLMRMHHFVFNPDDEADEALLETARSLNSFYYMKDLFPRVPVSQPRAFAACHRLIARGALRANLDHVLWENSHLQVAA